MDRWTDGPMDGWTVGRLSYGRRTLVSRTSWGTLGADLYAALLEIVDKNASSRGRL
ncbi:MAG: hypothetical protein HWE14_05675 [Flavobacteriia bacterium]|nr:hypothetical protein [Flavobacteriia bacterium]